MENKYGLKHRWDELIFSLSSIVSVYDKINRLMSFETDIKYRKFALKLIDTFKNKVILDAGSGSGIMAKLIENNYRFLIELDPIKQMIKFSKNRFKNNPKIYHVIGTFEKLPFKETSIDLITCAFALRDSKYMDLSIKEFYRVLKNGGSLLVIDLGKPDFLLINIIFMAYWIIIPVLVALMIKPKYVKHYTKIFITYIKYPTRNKMLELFKKFFRYVKHYFKAFGMVSIFISKK